MQLMPIALVALTEENVLTLMVICLFSENR